MSTSEITRKVAAIENGTVIDHLDPTTTFDVLKILHLKNELVAVGNYLDSSKIGKKGVIKIADRKLTKEQLSRIALLSPHAKASVIKNYEVVEKIEIEVPEKFVDIIRCGNPSCITRHQPVKTVFYVVKHPNGIKLRCHHCERTFSKDEIGLI